MSFLDPTSVAVVGASSEPGKVGHEVLRNLLEGFRGTVTAVNPKHQAVLGVRCVASVMDIEPRPDLVVVAVPAPFVEAVIRDCAKVGIPTVVIISAGFRELGTEEGKVREKVIQEIATEGGMQLVGPNCLGVLLPHVGANASFARNLPTPGNVALLSQSGAMAVALLDALEEWKSLGMSFVVSMGNKAVMEECDFLEIALEDRRTEVVGLYLESITNGRRFLEVAGRVAKGKPVVLLKSGVSAEGARAAASHTGSLAGSDAAVEAACRQAGVLRCRTSEEFLDTLLVLSSSSSLAGNRIVILTNAGGPGILASDAMRAEGLQLSTLAPATQERLRSVLPASASVGNPVDVVGDADAKRYADALEALRRDPEVDGLVVVLTPQVMTQVEETAKLLSTVKGGRRLLPIAAAFLGGSSVRAGVEVLRSSGVPSYPSPERAVRALARLWRAQVARKEQEQRAAPAVRRRSVGQRSTATKGIMHRRSGLLSEEIVADLFTLYHIPMPRSALARDPEEAVRMAEEIGFPVVLKVSSPDIVHKTDVGGIRANLVSVPSVREAFEQIQESVAERAPSAGVRGILVQRFLPLGQEFIVGAVRDPTFGHLLMVGWGGIYTEVFRDRTFRIAPLLERDAYAMLQELRAWEVLLGARTGKRSDIDALAGLLLKISELVTDAPEISDLDLNPVFVSEKGVVVADAKVIVG